MLKYTGYIRKIRYYSESSHYIVALLEVEEDQELCEIKTEKMNAQVESLYDGVITEIIGEVGQTYNVGDVTGYIEEED